MSTPTIDEFVRGVWSKGDPCPICQKEVKRVVLRKQTYYAIHDKSECVLVTIRIVNEGDYDGFRNTSNL